jgi:hypothetical protein
MVSRKQGFDKVESSSDSRKADISAPKVEGVETAILRSKKSPNKLIVDEATGDDNSVASINPATMEALGLFRGGSFSSVWRVALI